MEDWLTTTALGQFVFGLIGTATTCLLAQAGKWFWNSVLPPRMRQFTKNYMISGFGLLALRTRLDAANSPYTVASYFAYFVAKAVVSTVAFFGFTILYVMGSTSAEWTITASTYATLVLAMISGGIAAKTMLDLWITNYIATSQHVKEAKRIGKDLVNVTIELAEKLNAMKDTPAGGVAPSNPTTDNSSSRIGGETSACKEVK